MRFTSLGFRHRTTHGSLSSPSGSISHANYQRWIDRYDTRSPADRAAIRAHIEAFAKPPLISIVTSGGVADAPRLASVIASVRAQLYPFWELCIAARGGGGLDTLRADARVRIMHVDPQEGAVAINAALALATGEFVLFLEPGDRLPEHALYRIATEIEHAPNADILYSDEDFCDADGRRHSPYFKPDWDPDLALAQDLLGRLCVIRLSRVQALGGLRSVFDPAALCDLHLRLADTVAAECIRHVPAVLCHRALAGLEPREMASADYIEAAREALWQRCLARDPSVVAVEPVPRCPYWSRLVRAVPDPAPLVSVIVPTRDRAAVLRKCTEGVLHRTCYRPLELIIMDNDSVKAATTVLFEELRSDPRVRIIPSPGAFNFSRICNRGVAAATGAIILLLNNDIEIPNPDWLTEMVSHAVRPEIGAVGARLLYPSGRVQHAGMVLLPLAGAYHALRLSRGDDPGYFGQLALTRSCEAVTGACLALRRALFLEVGGLNERDLAVAYNDVDLCLRLSRRGYRNVCTPFAELIHVESLSRGSDRRGAKKARVEVELAYTAASAPERFAHDRYHNPNLDYFCDEGVLLAKPRRRKPLKHRIASCIAAFKNST